MNQRQNSPSEATYAQCGRQHFHPTFAVAISAGSMISAWPKEQRTIQREKAESQTSTQRELTTPVEGQGKQDPVLWPLRLSSPGGQGGRAGGDRKEAWGPRQVRGLPGFPQVLTSG